MFNLNVYDEVTSTNDVLKEIYNQAMSGEREIGAYEAVFAKHQTIGRGKAGASWFSKPNKAFCLSVLLNFEPDSKIAENISEVMPVTANLVKEVLSEMFSDNSEFISKLKVKLPNDVYVDDKKLVGVLGELIDETNNTAAIVGIGINVNFEKSELPFETATSLQIELAKEFDLDIFKDEFISNLIKKLSVVYPPL